MKTIEEHDQEHELVHELSTEPEAGGLDPRWVKAHHLVRVEGMSLRAAAQELEMSASGVRKWVKRVDDAYARAQPERHQEELQEEPDSPVEGSAGDPGSHTTPVDDPGADSGPIPPSEPYEAAHDDDSAAGEPDPGQTRVTIANGVLTWWCQACGGEVGSGSGRVQVDRDEATERAHSRRAPGDYDEPVRWHAFHKRCDPAPRTLMMLRRPVEDLNTVEGIEGLADQLALTRWAAYTDWVDLVVAAVR